LGDHEGDHETRPLISMEMDAESRNAVLQEQLRRMADRLEEVFSTASRLLSDEDLPHLLANITDQAASAVKAPRHLLVVQTSPDQPIQVYQHGLEEEEARALADKLWEPDPDDAGGSRLVVDVASSRQHYGRLAAIYPTGMQFMALDRQMFSLYATYAATALDIVTSLAESRRSNSIAQAMLECSRALSRATTIDEVTQTLTETVPVVARCERSSVLLWDPSKNQLVLAALSGGKEDEPPFVIAAADTPFVAALMTSRDIVVVDRDVQDPFLRALLDRVGTHTSAMAPLFTYGEFLGVVAADFLSTPLVDPRTDQDLQERLRALADHAVTAFQNARLLERVGHLAWHDALTGLPNRRLLEDKVRKELERSRRFGDPSALFYIDLDGLKTINDILGHDAGDDLICQISQQLKELARHQDTVARLGGDEFAVFLPGLGDLTAIRRLAGRMVDALGRAYTIGGTGIYSTASIGIAVYPEHGRTYEELISHADEAMYRSKNKGRNGFHLFDPATDDVDDGAQLQADLRHAVERNEFFVLYQPYIDVHTSQVVGAEALVRWRHPVRGVLEPAAFIPLAEKTGLIVDIDKFVVNEATRQLREWVDEGLAPLRVSVNVSSRDLLDPGFVGAIVSALRTNSVPPEWFEIETTGRSHRDDAGIIHQAINKLLSEGIRCSSAGADGSSLEQAATFPVTTIKIGQSFMQILGPAEEMRILAASTIGAAASLGLDYVAETARASSESRFLLQRGRTIAQGFFFSPPLFPHDVQRMLHTPAGETGLAAATTGDVPGKATPRDL